MQDRTFDIAIATFPYGGNGGASAEHPAVRNFLIELALKTKSDPRIRHRYQGDFSDTPITETRNDAVLWAREVKADFLLMVDSDMVPDIEQGDPSAKPFWDTSFDFVIQHYDKGPNVVCAPYCGPPPHRSVYVFYWTTPSADETNTVWRMEKYTREEAARMAGIQPCAAQPTGLILFDMRAFDLTDPIHCYNRLREKYDEETARQLTKPWFYYEYPDVYQAKKCSTEDVTTTRDLSFHGHLELGRDIIFCNWDAWAGHDKREIVRKPKPVDAGRISHKYREAAQRKQFTEEKRVWVKDEPKHEPKPIPQVVFEESIEATEVQVENFANSVKAGGGSFSFCPRGESILSRAIRNGGVK